MPALLLSARGLGKRFPGGRQVLRDVNLEVRAGGSLGIVGDSGAGKTTLGRILAGVDPPSCGEVLYRGRALGELEPPERRRFRRGVQMLFQDPEGSLNPVKTVRRSFEEVARLAGAPAQQREGLILESLAAVGLSAEILPRLPGQLSGGQNQRVALARILMLQPELIVLDEPTSGLDVSVQARILHLLKHLRHSRRLAYVYISHDVEVVGFMCEEAAVIREGTVAWSGPAASLAAAELAAAES